MIKHYANILGSWQPLTETDYIYGMDPYVWLHDNDLKDWQFIHVCYRGKIYKLHHSQIISENSQN